jgi:hypothetical protein
MLYPPLAHIFSFRSAGSNRLLLRRVGIFLSLPLLFCWGRGRGRFGMLLVSVLVLVYVLKCPVSCINVCRDKVVEDEGIANVPFDIDGTIIVTIY